MIWVSTQMFWAVGTGSPAGDLPVTPVTQPTLAINGDILTPPPATCRVILAISFSITAAFSLDKLILGLFLSNME